MKRIDKYIEQEKRAIPSPFLEERILARIEGFEAGRRPAPRRVVLWQSMAVAASFAVAVMGGIKLGDTYTAPDDPERTGIIIGDNYIEQLSIYITDDEQE